MHPPSPSHLQDPRALTGVAWLCDHDQSMWVLDGTRCEGGDGRDTPQHAPGLPATLFHPWPAAAHIAQVPAHVGERSSGTNAGEWCVSIRASQRDMRISPHDPCGFPIKPRTRLSCPASIPRFCRSLLRQHGNRCLRYPQARLPPSIALSRASPLEPAHDPGRLGTRTYYRGDARDGAQNIYHSLALWSGGAVRVLVACVVPLRCDGCLWHV